MLGFRKFPIAKKFMDKNGEYQRFLLNLFCLTVPNNFVGETLLRYVPESFEYRKNHGQGGEGRKYQNFSVANILSHKAETIRGRSSLCVTSYEKRYA